MDNSPKIQLKNKKITVVGLGKSGFSAARFLLGKKARVFATDSSDQEPVLGNADLLRRAGASVETGGHTEAFISGCGLVVTSPGVSRKSLPLVWAKEKKIPVISEVELASLFCRGRIVAVTGSNGKTTTVSLIHAIFKAAGKKSLLCGNVGNAFIDALPEIGPETTVVLELSSFQLEDSHRFHPAIAVLLNISRNHLDRHKTMGAYIQAKRRIFQNQTRRDYQVLNFDDDVVRQMGTDALPKTVFYSKHALPEGVFLDGKFIRVRLKKIRGSSLNIQRFKLPGSHNLENIMAGAAVASLCGIPVRTTQKVLDSFGTLPHRIEPIGSCGGVNFFNDSKSTTPVSTRAALLAVPGPVVLVAGGRDKGASFTEIEQVVAERAKVVILYGEAAKKIARSWKSFKRIQVRGGFEEAVRLGFEIAGAGDSLLLSPMCTSFDQFGSFEERGESFKRIFGELRAGIGKRVFTSGR